MRVLETQGKGAGGEIQLTDEMARMIGNQPFSAVTFAERRFDRGSKLGFVEATLALALERGDLRAEVRVMGEVALTPALAREGDFLRIRFFSHTRMITHYRRTPPALCVMLSGIKAGD